MLLGQYSDDDEDNQSTRSHDHADDDTSLGNHIDQASSVYTTDFHYVCLLGMPVGQASIINVNLCSSYKARTTAKNKLN